MNNEHQQIIDEVYRKYADSHWTAPSNPKSQLLANQLWGLIPIEHSKETFFNKCKTNTKFSERWGLKIEERELTYEERRKLYEEKTNLSTTYILSVKETLDKHNIPTKKITITYNNETIESYE